MHKKLLWPALPALALITLNLLVGCNEQESTAPPATVPPKPSENVPRALVSELEKRVEAERSVRLQTEIKLEKKEAEKSHWQSAALLMTSCAIVLLIVGTILGSKARHENER